MIPVKTNPLTDLIPEEARKYVYAVLALVVAVYTAGQAAEANTVQEWLEVVGSLLVTGGFGMGASNANPRRKGLRARKN